MPRKKSGSPEENPNDWQENEKDAPTEEDSGLLDSGDLDEESNDEKSGDEDGEF